MDMQFHEGAMEEVFNRKTNPIRGGKTTIRWQQATLSAIAGA
jgi:hypothetical protein